MPIVKNKKVIGLTKDELGRKNMIKPVDLRPKTYSYLIEDVSEDKKTKETKKCVIKRRLKINGYRNSLLNNEIMLKSQQRFKK